MDKYYILILGWVAVMGILSIMISMKRVEMVCGKEEYRWKPVWAVVTVVPLIWMCSQRGGIMDTGVYLEGFKDMPGVFSGIASYMGTVKKDKGFYFLSAVIKCIVGNNSVVYLFIIAVLQAGMLFYVYRKYSSRYLVSFFLFLASTDYISWMFNGMRQFLAVTITFIGIKFILDKKYVKAIILILIASLMHQSALLMIPFIFIVQGKAWNKKTLLFILAVIAVVASVGQFTNVLDSMLAETQYKNVVSDWLSWEDNGTNVLRVLVYAVPTILSLIGIKYIRNADNPIINLSTNMSIVSVGFYVVSMFTSGIFIGRLPIYFSLYSYILLPWEIDNMFTKRSARLVYIMTVCAYLVFYYYQMHFAWNFI